MLPKRHSDPETLQAWYPQVPRLLQLSYQCRDRERHPIITHRIGYDDFCPHRPRPSALMHYRWILSRRSNLPLHRHKRKALFGVLLMRQSCESRNQLQEHSSFHPLRVPDMPHDPSSSLHMEMLTRKSASVPTNWLASSASQAIFYYTARSRITSNPIA